MKARTVDALAAQIGRPPKALAALSGLSPEQVEVLSAALHAASERERRAILDASHAPGWLRPFARTVMRSLAR